MKELYREQDFSSLEQARKRYLGRALLSLGIGLAASLLLLLALTRTNKLWLFLIQTVLFSLGFSLALIFYLGHYLPIRHREELVDVALHNPRLLCKGKIKNLGKTFTISSSIQAKEVEVESSEGLKTLYWDPFLGDSPFQVGEEVCLQLADNWIVGIEAQHE